MLYPFLFLYCRTLANDVDEDQYKDFYYKHHGGAVSFNGGTRGEGSSQQYYMAIEVRIPFFTGPLIFAVDLINVFDRD